MAGLLYKDFVAIRGKIYVLALVAVMFFLFVARVLIKEDATEYLLVMFLITFVIGLYVLVSNKIETDLLRVDEAKRQKQYCLSLPINRKQYVAAKYVFVLLTYFIIQSYLALFCSIMAVGYKTNTCLQMVSVIMEILPIVTTMMLVVSAVELPFFIGAGYKKGNFIKQSILEAFFVVLC